jgi:acyl-homoserine-lactone acylase
MKHRLQLGKLVLVLAAAAACFAFQAARDSEVARWEKEARNVTIIRDDWGIAHVYGKTDADAVFGMIYAQAEDDFNRVETNYIDAIRSNWARSWEVSVGSVPASML